MSLRPFIAAFVAAFVALASCLFPLAASADPFPRYLRISSDNVTNTYNLIELTGTGFTLTNLGNNVVRLTLTGGTSGTDSNTVNALIAAGTSLNASNWLGWAGASNWLHTAFLSINGTATVAQTALDGWPTQWNWLSITGAPSFVTASITNGLVSSITGGGTWSLSGGAYTFTPTGITAAAQSALDGKVGTNHVGNVSLSNGIYSITSAIDAAWPGWSIGNYNYGLGTSTTPVPVEVNSSLAVNGWVLVNPRGTGIQRWNWHLFEGWGLESDKRLTLAAGRPAGEAAIFYFQPSSNLFHTVRIGSDVTDAVGLFVTGSNGWVSVNKRTPTVPLDVSGTIQGSIVQGSIVQATTSIVVTNFGYDPATIGVFIGTNKNFATEIAGGIRNGFIANSGNAFANMVGQTALSTIYGGGVTGDAYRRFRITADGSGLWGDGTYSPDILMGLASRSNLVFNTQTLEVKNNLLTRTNLFINGSTTNTITESSGGIIFQRSGSPAYIRLLPAANDVYFQNSVASGNIFFSTLGGVSSSGDVIYLVRSIGISTNLPAAKLHVNGSAIVESNLTVLGAVSGNGTGVSNVINAIKVMSSTVTTNFLTLDSSGVPIYVSGTTTQKVTLGSYP